MLLRSTLGALALGLLTAGPVAAQQQGQCSITQTVVAIPAATSTPLVSVNVQRRGLEFQNIGANGVTIARATTATATTGLILAAGTGGAGGSEKFFSGPTPADAFSAFSTSGTSVLVWECW